MRRGPDPRAVHAAFRRIAELTTERRAAALARLAASDPALHDAVARLLRHADPATAFLVPPPRVEWRTPEDDVGRVLGGRWKLLGVLGAGGSGAVFRAEDRESGHRAALKLVRGLSDDRIRAVRREIAFLRWLRLPGVVRLLDDGADGEEVFCVMDLVRGERFPGTRCRRAWESVEGPSLRLLETLAGIHAAGVVHRDLKPANVLVTRDGVVTVLDLGVSAEVPRRFERGLGGATGGTPAYAAPEQRRGARADPRSDLFSFGVMVFEALSGGRPAGDWRARCRTLEAPPRVRRAVAALLEPRRTDRPRDAWSAIEALQPVSPSRVRRTPWTEEELRTRFAGPDLLLHLREDAAAELFRRTEGAPRDVEREIRSWVRTGLAHEDAGVVVIDREGIERLRAIPRTRSTARAGTEARLDTSLFRALRSGSPREVLKSAQGAADHGLAHGRPQAALAAAFEGAAAARAAGDTRGETRILLSAATAAIVMATAAALDRVLLLLQRADASGRELHDVETVVRAALEMARGRANAALDAVAEVCRRSRNRGVLRLAWSVRDTVARALGPREERRAVAGLRRWLPRSGIRGWRGILASAEGWRSYRASRFDDAVRLHLDAARLAPDADARLRCLLDAAVAAVEGDSPEARDLAERAQEEAAALRNPVAEGRALELERTIHLQRGTARAPYTELVEVSRRLGYPGLTAGIAFTEAAIAWRLGRRAAAARLAGLAASIDGPSPRGMLARALGAAARGGLPSAEVRQCEASLGSLPPTVALQVLALLAVACPGSRTRLRRLARPLRFRRSVLAAPHVREVLSVEEAKAILGGGGSGILSPPAQRRRVSP